MPVWASFDYVQDEYNKNGVKVRRGYADDGMVTVTGRDGSDAMRKVDIDVLYGEYLAAGKGCTMSANQRVLDLKNGAHIWK